MSNFGFLRSRGGYRGWRCATGERSFRQVFGIVILFLATVIGIGYDNVWLFASSSAHAQTEDIEPPRQCRQWMVTVFSANFPAYVPLDDLPWPDDSLRDASISLPPDWEPLLVQGGFAALIPAKRCLDWE